MTVSDHSTDEREPLQREAWKWVLHVTSGAATKGDIAALRAWQAENPLHAEAFAHASRRWQTFGPVLEQVAQQREPKVATPGLSAASSPEAGAVRSLPRRAFLGGALAASAAVGAGVALRSPLGLWPSYREFTADYRTGAGEQHSIVLAGAGKVEMNTRTSLNIRDAVPGVDRIELIGGEAAVATGARPVEVLVGDGRVLADVAQFNVRYDDAGLCVTCVGGSVRVEQSGQSVTMLKSQQLVYTRHSFSRTTAVDPAVVTAWRDGSLLFRDEPVAHVLEEVNRYRRGRIILMNDALGARRITAHLKLDRLDVIVTQLMETFGARITTLPGAVTIVS
jgi:transmembrane sensor